MKAIVVWIVVCCAGLAMAQSPGSVTAIGKCNAPNSGNNSTVTVTCYGVDKKLAEQIGLLVAASKRDGKTLKDISDKIDIILKEIEDSRSTTTVIQQAPNGINIGPGATATNPQVNNFGPVAGTITWTEEVTTPLGNSGNEKVMTIHLKTDRVIPGAIIGLILSGPVTMTQEYWTAHAPTIKPSGGFEVDISAPLTSNATTIPDSMALKVVIPSAFTPGQDLAVVVTSKVDVHVIEAADITSKFR